MGKGIGLALALTIAACQQVPGDMKAFWCGTNAPIRLSDAQIASLTDAQAAQFAAHNAKGAAWCGWTEEAP